MSNYNTTDERYSATWTMSETGRTHVHTETIYLNLETVQYLIEHFGRGRNKNYVATISGYKLLPDVTKILDINGKFSSLSIIQFRGVFSRKTTLNITKLSIDEKQFILTDDQNQKHRLEFEIIYKPIDAYDAYSLAMSGLGADHPRNNP